MLYRSGTPCCFSQLRNYRPDPEVIIAIVERMEQATCDSVLYFIESTKLPRCGDVLRTWNISVTRGYRQFEGQASEKSHLLCREADR